MNSISKCLALLAYLLGPLGWLYVLVFQRRDAFAVFHAKQALLLTVTAPTSLAVWGLTAWTLSWLPFFGFVAAVILFSFVVAIWLLLGALSVVGMVQALGGRCEPFPWLGPMAERLPIHPASGTQIPEAESPLA